MVCYVDLPAGHTAIDSYIAALMSVFGAHSAVIEVLLCNIVEFHTAGLWERLPQARLPTDSSESLTL
eukprot:COSAG03_NODE_323_length_8989_cov_6.562655_1_plen_67_part_00